jgi:hypothetical protein
MLTRFAFWKSIKVLTFCALLSVSSAQADSDKDGRNPAVMTGQDFIDMCSKPDNDSIGFCHGFIQAAHDAFSDSLCTPAGVTRADLVGLVHDFLLEAEDARELYAISVVGSVLSRRFPC